MIHEWKRLSNDPKLLEVTHYQPAGCKTQLLRGGSGAVIGGMGAWLSGTPIELGMGIGTAAGVIFPQIGHTARAIEVDIHLIKRFVRDIRDGRATKK